MNSPSLYSDLSTCRPGIVVAGQRFFGNPNTPLGVLGGVFDMKHAKVALFIGTLLSAIASANGCVNDAARAWFSMGRDRYLPEWFGAVHPTYRTPFRSILFLMPIWAVFALNEYNTNRKLGFSR